MYTRAHTRRSPAAHPHGTCSRPCVEGQEKRSFCRVPRTVHDGSDDSRQGGPASHGLTERPPRRTHPRPSEAQPCLPAGAHHTHQRAHGKGPRPEATRLPRRPAGGARPERVAAGPSGPERPRAAPAQAQGRLPRASAGTRSSVKAEEAAGRRGDQAHHRAGPETHTPGAAPRGPPGPPAGRWPLWGLPGRAPPSGTRAGPSARTGRTPWPRAAPAPRRPRVRAPAPPRGR